VKVLAILGSPRPGGNTDVLATQLLEGAAEAGAETQAVALRRLNIQPCSACERCWDDGQPCRFDDDMAPLYDAIAAAQVLVFVTPVYWYAPTAIMKAFMDRLVPFNRPQGRPAVAGKQGVLVTACEEETAQAAAPLVHMFELSFAYLGMTFADRLVVTGTGPKGAVLDNGDALERARAIGRRLARG
jgi:multimeric flavodoxin WrbA